MTIRCGEPVHDRDGRTAEVASPGVLRLHDGDRLDLRIGPARKSPDGAELRMLACNGSVPGASLHVVQGSDITVQVTNGGDAAATVDWHGLRLDNRYDGVPDETQAPIPVGGTFAHQLRFRDARVLLVPPAQILPDLARGPR